MSSANRMSSGERAPYSTTTRPYSARRDTTSRIAGRRGASPIPPVTMTMSPPMPSATSQPVPNGPRTPIVVPGWPSRARA